MTSDYEENRTFWFLVQKHFGTHLMTSIRPLEKLIRSYPQPPFLERRITKLLKALLDVDTIHLPDSESPDIMLIASLKAPNLLLSLKNAGFHFDREAFYKCYPYTLENDFYYRYMLDYYKNDRELEIDVYRLTIDSSNPNVSQNSESLNRLIAHIASQ